MFFSLILLVHFSFYFPFSFFVSPPRTPKNASRSVARPFFCGFGAWAQQQQRQQATLKVSNLCHLATRLKLQVRCVSSDPPVERVEENEFAVQNACVPVHCRAVTTFPYVFLHGCAFTARVGEARGRVGLLCDQRQLLLPTCRLGAEPKLVSLEGHVVLVCCSRVSALKRG